MDLKVKNVIFPEFKINHGLSQGLEITHRNVEGQDYASLVGTKQQINEYLQQYPPVSDRLRTLNSVPKYRIINSHKERIY